MTDALLWWAALQATALAALPVTVLVFRALPDRGYGLGKALGPLLFTLLVWYAGLTQAVPMNRGAVWGLFYLFMLGNVLLARVVQDDLRALWREQRGALIATELLFALSFGAWAFVRAYNPEIESTEKPMDFAMLNAAYRSDVYPPGDPWMAGMPVAYYYLGYLTNATLAKLAAIPTAAAFNLAIATAGAQAAVGAFAVTANLAAAASRRPLFESVRLRPAHLLAGLGAAVLLTAVSNLEGMVELLRARGWGSADLYAWMSIKDLRLTGPSSLWYPDDNWFWWRSTRVLDTIVDGRSLDYTISEYPMFSLLLGDLHPHLMALPLTLLALGVAVALTLGPLPKRWGRGAALTVLAPAVALGALGFANIWDLPTYAVVLLAVGALRTAMEPPSGASSAEPDDAPAAADDAAATAKPHNSGQRRRWLLYLQWAGLALLATALLFSPFYLGIVASSRGAVASGSGGGPIAFWWGPGSRPLHLLLFWGPLLLAAGAFAWGLTAKLERRVRSQARAGLLVLPAIWVALELAAYRGTPDPASLAVIWVTRLWPLGPILAGVALLVGQVRAARNASNQSEATAARATALAVLLLGAALSLLAVCEWLYLRDVFNNRMNTVFKLYYQAWTLFSVGAAFGLYYIYEKRLLSRSGRGALGVTLGLALVGCLAVTPAALANRTGGFSRTPTLDGLAFLERVSPAESAAVVWLREQPGAAAILEAPGPQYSGYSQLSARTGVPSVLGWSGHERQWRGPSPAIGEREQDADQVYQAPNKSTILGILRKYGVEFVVVGPSERAKYPAPALAAFDAAFPAAFKQGSVTIYRVPGAGNGAAR